MDNLTQARLLLAILRKALHSIDSECAEFVMLIEDLLTVDGDEEAPH